MKKLWIAGGVLLAGALFAVRPAEAQPANDPEAKKILDAVSAKYRSYDLVKAVFSFTMEGPSGGSGAQEGILYVSPGTNRYRIELGGQEMISDGSTAWVYLKDANEVQVSAASSDPEMLGPSQLFTIHEQGFRYLLKDEVRLDGRLSYLIDLVPPGESPYSKIELGVDKDAGFIRQVKIFAKNGDRYLYKIRELVPNPSAGHDIFTFNKASHPGVEVVDLR